MSAPQTPPWARFRIGQRVTVYLHRRVPVEGRIDKFDKRWIRITDSGPGADGYTFPLDLVERVELATPGGVS